MMQLCLLKFVHVWLLYLMLFSPCLIMTSILLSWCSLGIRLHHYSKEPPHSWWIFTLSLAPLPRGGRGKAAAGQITTTDHRLLENLLYLNLFCDFRWRPTITRTITTCGLFRDKTIMDVNTLFKYVEMWNSIVWKFYISVSISLKIVLSHLSRFVMGTSFAWSTKSNYSAEQQFSFIPDCITCSLDIQ